MGTLAAAFAAAFLGPNGNGLDGSGQPLPPDMGVAAALGQKIDNAIPNAQDLGALHAYVDTTAGNLQRNIDGTASAAGAAASAAASAATAAANTQKVLDSEIDTVSGSAAFNSTAVFAAYTYAQKTPPAADSSTLVPNTAWVGQNFALATVSATAGAALKANTLVAASSGPSNPSLATADNTVAAAAGFVLAAAASGAAATLVRAGPLGGFSGLTPGATYWLGTGGTVQAAAPSASGTAIQIIGIATSATVIDVRLGRPIVNE